MFGHKSSGMGELYMRGGSGGGGIRCGVGSGYGGDDDRGDDLKVCERL